MLVIAPFSNSFIRDWPAEHYSATVGLLLDKLRPEEEVWVIGTSNQRSLANNIVRPYSAERVLNRCGDMSWPDVLRSLRVARCVVGNNSGIAHLSGYFGTPTVCVFGGSHQRNEWRPLGPSVVLVSRAVGCSPCQLDHGQSSPYGKACLRQIEPIHVAQAVMLAMDRRSGGPQ